jgi:hypothetical protein
MPLRASDPSTNSITTHSAAVISKSVTGLSMGSTQNATSKTAGAAAKNEKENIASRQLYGENVIFLTASYFSL